jgi:hypothetical protein
MRPHVSDRHQLTVRVRSRKQIVVWLHAVSSMIPASHDTIATEFASGRRMPLAAIVAHLKSSKSSAYQPFMPLHPECFDSSGGTNGTPI